MMTLYACITGFVLDALFGDPYWLYHPVRMIGKLISFLENPLRKAAGDSPQKQLAAGCVLWVLVVSVSTAVPALLLWGAAQVHRGFVFALESFWCYQILAARSLSKESMKVYQKLEEKDLAGARHAVSMIVGRDTERLDEVGVAKAAVETVAENTSDGVTAPLLFLMLGGPAAGFLYKAVNTMDSMLGYKNEKNLYFGRAAAKLDDVFNYIPARISALLMIAGAFLTGMDAENAAKIYRRDRRNHASPNSAQTESVCAGALRVQLAGDAWYFGKLHKKQTIGDALRPVEPEDIRRSIMLMYTTSLLMLLLCGGIRFLFLRLLLL